MTDKTDSDVLIVGAGPAGLSAALYLARYGRSVALFDTSKGRSTHHQINHNYLGFPDGVRATELRRLGLEQVCRYEHVMVRNHRIDSLEQVDGRFRAEGQYGTASARAVILATGVLDHYPHFHGWESYVGISMFWCVTCDGYESRGKRIVVAGATNAAAAEAIQLSRMSQDITLISNSADSHIDDVHLARLERAGIPFIHDMIRAAEGSGDGQLQRLLTEEGREIEVEALFVTQGATPETRLAEDLGARLTDDGYLEVDIEQRTTVAGVFGAGDVTNLYCQQVSAAVHQGGQAASAANYWLYPSELQA